MYPVAIWVVIGSALRFTCVLTINRCKFTNLRYANPSKVGNARERRLAPRVPKQCPIQAPLGPIRLENVVFKQCSATVKACISYQRRRSRHCLRTQETAYQAINLYRSDQRLTRKCSRQEPNWQLKPKLKMGWKKKKSHLLFFWNNDAKVFWFLSRNIKKVWSVSISLPWGS